MYAGNSQNCDVSAVTIGVTNTGQKVGSDTVFEVEVKNTCRCSASNIAVFSLGFSSSMKVDPKLFRIEGKDYVVNDKKAIASMESVKFQYSWSRPFRMSVLSVQFDSC